MNESYWGSVRFYIHLYTAGFIALLLIPVFAGIWFWQVSMAAPRTIVQVEKDNTVKTGVDKIVSPDAPPPVTSSYPYQRKYPELFAAMPERKLAASGTVYLTFDDGPSPVTEKVLDVLKQYGVPSTFFVVGNRLTSEAGQKTARRIVREGHSIGLHSNTHRYRTIYASVENWLDDFAIAEKRITEVTGIRPTIFRFPGGSINVYNGNLYQELIAEMTRRGYVYFDWNVSSGDISAVPVRAETLLANITSQRFDGDPVIVLMHDSASKTETLRALPKIIEYYRSKGMTFGKLQNNIWPVAFGYRS